MGSHGSCSEGKELSLLTWWGQETTDILVFSETETSEFPVLYKEKLSPMRKIKQWNKLLR